MNSKKKKKKLVVNPWSSVIYQPDNTSAGQLVVVRCSTRVRVWLQPAQLQVDITGKPFV